MNSVGPRPIQISVTPSIDLEIRYRVLLTGRFECEERALGVGVRGLYFLGYLFWKSHLFRKISMCKSGSAGCQHTG